jgi:hypothetical protein
MTSNGPAVLECLRSALRVLSELPTDVHEYVALDEADLLESNRLFADALLVLRGAGALIAGEVHHRSMPQLGSRGLAQRSGHRTPEQFIKITTGSTAREAVTAVRVGVLLREAATAGEADAVTGEIADAAQPWLGPVAATVQSRAISIEAAEAIRAGLGVPNAAVDAEQLEDAARQLCVSALRLDPDSLSRQARAFRDELDLAGVALREEERRSRRSLRLFVQPDGMTKLVWVMDTETAASVSDLYDRATSPKRGGVRFVDPKREALSEEFLHDARTPEQLASDDFEQLLKLGAAADPRFLLGSGAPVIRVTVARDALRGRQGLARIEGQATPVSISTVERLQCEGSHNQVVLDATGKVLDFGREQRFFTRRQREALALMWGGCAAPGCERPPSWCEAHHIVFWARDGGRTDLDDGILLCRHHHLLFHNNNWEIERDRSRRYWLIPPADLDRSQNPIELVSRSRALDDLTRVRVAG